MAVRDAKFIALVGHDTNIANIAGILDLTWTQAGYQRNQTPPAGALVFEVRMGADKKQRVYTSYLAQSPEQMRQRVAADAGSPAAQDAAADPRLQRQHAGLSLPHGRVRGRDAQCARPRLRGMT